MPAPKAASEKSERARHIFAAMMDGRSLREIAGDPKGWASGAFNRSSPRKSRDAEPILPTTITRSCKSARLEQALELLGAEIDAGKAAAVPALSRVIEQLSKLTERQLNLTQIRRLRLADEVAEMEERFERLAVASEREAWPSAAPGRSRMEGKESARSRTPRKALKIITNREIADFAAQ